MSQQFTEAEAIVFLLSPRYLLIPRMGKATIINPIFHSLHTNLENGNSLFLITTSRLCYFATPKMCGIFSVTFACPFFVSIRLLFDENKSYHPRLLHDAKGSFFRHGILLSPYPRSRCYAMATLQHFHDPIRSTVEHRP